MTARIVATESVSLDGVMQGVGRPDEDTRGGFAHGGWGRQFTDPVVNERMAQGRSGSGGMLLGRRTYEDVLGYWTTSDPDGEITGHLLRADKYVVSRDPATTLSYPGSTLLAGDAASSVAALRDRLDGTLSVIGSGELVRSLHAAGLVDEYALLVHPLVLGSGQRLFGPGDLTDLVLEDSVTGPTGLVLLRYRVRPPGEGGQK
ncbi:dihydrofolate reductase family protein [Phycicoccus flavus]|uniref:dihydrofolate reductase family protein n=1 Tax=Phycicoccus flavus TaxID=2502783 RepID=UPI000FEC18F5|nr:dihydrofolate reductase family protein [Phycicoccus flavus]NHA69192.1 deaminase [Phycicoccus flavus]